MIVVSSGGQAKSSQFEFLREHFLFFFGGVGGVTAILKAEYTAFAKSTYAQAASFYFFTRRNVGFDIDLKMETKGFCFKWKVTRL